jgi:uncharacterized membrane protein YkvA (DUF1232 family)
MSWRDTAARLKREVYTLYFAVRDPRVPWYAKALAGSIVAYAFSPIDLIPDFIPILGYLDDLVVIPLGVLLVRRLIPPQVLADCRTRAEAMSAQPRSAIGAAVVVGIWLVLAGLGILLTMRWFNRPPV